jgi:hypothetical protein
MLLPVAQLVIASLGLGAEMRTVPLDAGAIKPVKVKVEKVASYKGRAAVRVSDAAPDAQGDVRIALAPGVEFEDGVIEIDMAGDVGEHPIPGARGFVGLAFRVNDAAPSYEAFYLRPLNGRADDQLQRNHSVQYISTPEFPWERLRSETPGKYETYVDLQGGAWNHVKIEVQGVKARLYVNGAEQPTLLVNDLKHGVSKGGIALWVGPSTVAHFANLKVSR